MRYYLDCEFDGHGGPLISLALYRKDGRHLYLVRDDAEFMIQDLWVRQNVFPILRSVPSNIGIDVVPIGEFGQKIAEFFQDETPYIVCDWPMDASLFSQTLMIRPDRMATLPNYVVQVFRIDAYEGTPFKNAVRHNAAWDAIVLCDAIEP
ncbi:Rnase H [Caulobacter phage CcrBL9]|uniref:Uncharacterized protein n=1 Tax=Caulobacter phage CcrBL9 TaxID=2283270 RepID=A0A385EEV9_9CAUD|nr:Rnase H [Caulobacter phage CcrBL9]AXQ69382.1 hypothetical protein CcrBL9_gp358 [Caulobacter phage CcrBL9]